MAEIYITCFFFVVSCVGVGVFALADSKVVLYENEADGNRYHFMFYTDYGISRDETGELVKKDNKDIWIVKGTSSYSEGNKVYKTTYTADENGYSAKTEAVDPVASVPAATLASLAGGGLG